MVAVNRQLAVADMGDDEFTRVALVVDHFDLGADPAELGRYILDVVGIGKRRVVRTEAFFRRQYDIDGIAHHAALERLLDLVEQVVLAAVDIADGHVGLFDDLTRLVGNRVGERDHLVLAYKLTGHPRLSRSLRMAASCAMDSASSAWALA